MLDFLRISPYQQSDCSQISDAAGRPSGPSVACSRMASASLGRSNVRNPNSAVAVRARAFSLCVAVALIVACGSSRNKADDVKAATDAIRQQIAVHGSSGRCEPQSRLTGLENFGGNIVYPPAGHAHGWEEVKEIYKFL
jgi:hypothetical protein